MNLNVFFLIASSHPRASITLLLALTASARVHAAGGHHAVDDAAILEPDQCQLETWADRETGGLRSLSHVGPGCRVGPVELSLNLDRTRAEAGNVTAASPQIKWAQAMDDRLSVGVVASATQQDHPPHRVGNTLALLATWQPGETALVHVNAGRDFRPGRDDSNHSGVALEWKPSPAWSFVGERFREGGVDLWRAGARWSMSTAWNVDISRASGLRNSTPAWWTVGLTWAFTR